MNTIALVGNPNSGKTTLFNALTGSNQHVGNWPGVTVEKKEGLVLHNGTKINIVDLPGSYSLGAYSEDEFVARNYILRDKPDLVINVIDATNLERGLYLTSQLLEIGTKTIIALNMMDEAKEKDIEIDIKRLSDNLGLPIMSTVASKKKGIDELLKACVEYIDQPSRQKDISTYGIEIDKEIDELVNILDKANLDYSNRWIAIKLLERDKALVDYIKSNIAVDNFKRIESIIGKSEDFELEIVDKRYEFVNQIINNSVIKPDVEEITLTDKVDKIITHKYLGLPIFGIIMFIIFQLTFVIGSDLLGGYLASAIENFGEFIVNLLEGSNSPKLLTSFITEGIIGGIGAVFEFIPLIVVLYLFLGILEDTGYMARAAYIMDGIMRKLGLHGKTFISMIVGFGCNVPGIMATRTLENKKDRMIAILINPFISCGARLPVYLVFIAAFFPDYGGIVLFSLYILGIIMALILGKVFSKTLFKGESSYFIMELPPYRLPYFRAVIRDMWDKVWDFIHRAGTIILVVISFLWVLANLPLGVEPYSQASILGQMGTFLSPIFIPAGYGTWQATVSLFAGIAAKEAVVATLGMVYAELGEGTQLVNTLQSVFTPLTAISYMVMVLFYTPCAAVIATVKRETSSSKWALFIALYPFILGWIASVVIYQVGNLLGF